MNLKFILYALMMFFCVQEGAFAMKPGPFEDVHYVDPVTKYSVTASAGPTGTSSREAGPTKVLDDKGKLLWSTPDFSGRHELKLSPDGKILLFIGNFFFNSTMQLSPTEQIVAVYEDAKLIKKIIFSDLIKENPEKLAEQMKIPIMGGGWVGRSKFIDSIEVNWKARELSFKLYNSETKTIKF